MVNVIKDYLVSLGFSVDSNSLSNAKSAMSDAEGFVKRFANSSVTQFAVATAAVGTFVAVINKAIASVTVQLAQNDLEMEKWARSMYTSKENAVVLNNAIKAMGVSMSDLYLSPELLDNFKKLQSQSVNLLPPAEYSKQMKFIRSIMFEWQRFKLIVTYAMQWVGYYLFKYISKPLQDLKLSFKGFNDLLSKTMPEWTKVIAQVLSWFVRLGIAAATAGKEIINLFQELPRHVIVTGSALTGLFAIMRMGPIGWLIAGLTALLLLMDDYAGYKNHKKSAFAGIWEELEDDGALGDLKKNTSDILTNISQLVISLGEFMDKLAKLMGFKNFADFLEKAFLVGLRELNKLLKEANQGLEGLNKIADGKVKEGSKDLGNSAKDLTKDFSPGGWILKGFKNLITGAFGGGDPEANLNSYMQNKGYIAPQAYHRSITSNQTNNFSIYGGGEPSAVAMAVSGKIPTNILTRSTRGVEL